MNRIRTFVDTGVLIAIARGDDKAADAALAILDDPNREFVSSDFVQLEVLPKAAFHRRNDELNVYREFFEGGLVDVVASKSITQSAIAVASEHDIHAMDALHIASALEAGVDEFVTTEKPSKPMFKLAQPRVVSIHPGATS
ncbi:MAG: PIN domain-containing protein [Phycisphaerae bacterium]|nr:PIN domain-containing protein [Phycisphaerae bacterium]